MISGYAAGGDAPTKQLELVPGALEEANRFLVDKDETQQRLARVFDLIEGFESPFGLELLATVHWVAKHESAQSVDAAVAHTYAWNSRKRQFSPRQIALALEVLAEKNWVD